MPKNFNSRPHGGRPSTTRTAQTRCTFQLTPSRRATRGNHLATRWQPFQLTPSRRATPSRQKTDSDWYFNSRPHGGRQRLQLPGQAERHFNSRPHGGRRCFFLCCFDLLHFNSRPHGGRQLCNIIVALYDHFNSRPHGGRHRIRCEFLIRTHFNSRPHGGRREYLVRQRPERINFNSRPHGGRLLTDDSYQETLKFQLTPSRRATMVHGRATSHCVISTHALTEGDGERMPRTIWTKSFQLTPSRRATAAVFTQNCFPQYFNSRPHGGRPWREAAFARFLHFNSRPHGGRPQAIYEKGIEDANFNSRPHGGRQQSKAIEEQRQYFNSRPHGGRRNIHRGKPGSRKFQLTPSRRATGIADAKNDATTISTHALTEGDITCSASSSVTVISTHALTEGDSGWNYVKAFVKTFQLTPSRRATPIEKIFFSIAPSFQLTPSRRATFSFFRQPFSDPISTHALTEGDLASSMGKVIPTAFQLTPSRRATVKHPREFIITTFQLTPSRRATDGAG